MDPITTLQELFKGKGLFFFAGPCVIENEAHTHRLAEELVRLFSPLEIPFVFKASFDKANRSSVSSYRGPGLSAGLRILADIKKSLSVPILTDVHEPGQVADIAEVADIIQVPAFLCRQTDLLLEAGRSGKIINVKKGQFMAPWDMANVIDKITSTGNRKIILTERGFSFGYNNLVVDFRNFPAMRDLGYPVVFDATHSVQLPGGAGTSSGGDARFIKPLSRAAAACGVDGFFFEVHDNPCEALCDGPNAFPLADFADHLRLLLRLHKVVTEGAGDES